MRVVGVAPDRADEVINVAVVGGAQGQQGQVAVAGGRKRRIGQAAHVLGAAGADGTVDEAGLAEATAAGAATVDFDRGAIEDGLGGGDKGVERTDVVVDVDMQSADLRGGGGVA